MSETASAALCLSFSLSLSPHINICGWLMLAPEQSAEKGGLVLTAAIAVVKGQEGVMANRQLLHKCPWANCPTLIREIGQEKVQLGRVKLIRGGNRGASWELQVI